MLSMMFALVVGIFMPTAAAETPDQPDVEVAYKRGKSSEETEAEIDAAAAEEERKRKEKLARVIVLKWPDTSTDYLDETLQRNIRSRIARPDAMFFPEVDLYQNGRKVKDRTIIPAMQPAIVSDIATTTVMRAVDEIAGVPWDGLQPAQWSAKADELREIAEEIWFVDRVELREPMFLLYAQIGRAAENRNFAAPPFYEEIGGFAVNYYWYQAATLAYQEPALMSKLTDQELTGSISYLLQQLQNGAFPTLKLDFELENHFEEDFNDNYEVRLNGLPIELDSNAQIDIFLGRTDIYLKRLDTGHGLSERLEIGKLKERIYSVREVARKLMGVDFIEQLFLYKNECVPEVDGDILNYLAIYAKLHEKAEIYIAVPENGNPNRVYVWRYDRASAQLSLVGGGSDGFPVRFAFVFSSGLLYNGATVTYTEPSAEDVEGIEAGDVVGVNLGDATGLVDADLDPAFLPLNLELRGHYNRLMINMGAEFSLGLTDGGDLSGTGEDTGRLIEYYQHPGNNDQGGKDEVIAVQNPTASCTTDADGKISCSEIYNIRDFNRYLYLGAGMVLGRDAGIGFGPRFAGRFGWTNIPHAYQTTAHFGWAIQPPIPQAGGRVRPMLDADLRGGVAIARQRSLQRDLSASTKADNDEDNDEGNVMPVFGLNIGIGLTF